MADRTARAAKARETNRAIIEAAANLPAAEPAGDREFSGSFPRPTAISEQLFEANIDLANAAANRWAAKTGQPLEDLESVSRMGLLRGCRKYDPSRINPHTGEPYALATIACPFIEGELLHHFRDSKSYAVKFPPRWREQWGKARRGLKDPTMTMAQVAASCGMSVDELREMSAAMTGTVELNEEVVGRVVPDEGLDMMDGTRLLLRKAFGNLPSYDRDLIDAWIESPGRRILPGGPRQQYDRRVRSVLHGQQLKQYLQQQLAIEVPTVEVERKAPQPKRVKVEAETPSLFATGRRRSPRRAVAES